jgi:hypothetical protein
MNTQAHDRETPPVLHTTTHDAQPRTTQPLTGSDPLLQLEYESRPPTGPGVVRCINHPHELALRGIPVICPACRARRDWALVNEGRHVWIRCRCGNQWPEPEITRADFDALIENHQWTNHSTTEQALTALGFDGSLAGTYLL